MIRAFQWDLARQVERLDHLLALLPRYADWGYTRLYLHLEDAVDYPSLPGLARADAYTWAELETLVAAAASHGIQTVPIANLLGHTQYVIKHPDWRDLNELRDPATGEALPTGQICPLHPRTADLVSRLFGDLAPLCTAGEIHAGLDESFHLGKHPLSRAEVAEVGLAAHFARHVTRLHASATRLGLRLGLWADMLALLPEAIPLLPAHAGLAAYDWYYHPFGRHPRMELYNFAEYDLAPALAAAGIAYWACPMNGAFRHESAPVWTDRLQNLAAWNRRAQDTGAAGYLVTSWEPHRLAFPTTSLMDAAAATLWLDPSTPDDPASLLAAGLRRYEPVLGAVAARSLARRILATDAQAFVGNSRWEINNGWAPVASRRDSPLPFARASRRLSRLATTPELTEQDGLKFPLQFLAATARFLAYLAEREAFVRICVAHIHRLRRLVNSEAADDSAAMHETLRLADEQAARFADSLSHAREDARLLWTTSRSADTFASSPNARLLAVDEAQLLALRAWFDACGGQLAHVFRASPVCGRWTLRFILHHFAPAHQKVVIEQQSPDGTWRELHSRVLIEFRGQSAQVNTPKLRFEFACPVENPDAPLRIASRCLGEFAVSHIELTDGVDTRRMRKPEIIHGRDARATPEHQSHGRDAHATPGHQSPGRDARATPERHRLGQPAPTSGWPKIDWLTNTGELPLNFG
ncbi:MAG: family 20 glycosylhydrolase [Opitutus sp.]|nr:family 20 glycosylhydrolase [Opitutus sp.]MCS6247988.1 family 20 glycosylhydrolase [Opitutus sp.]MCS6274552.1 family 20 glycosylhydrolase [Opitutus sp.]MCS6299845.1 family 20 glycosylhydrolase [Opitutus sp.]